MKQITPEIKQRIAAMYWGQTAFVQFPHEPSACQVINDVSINYIDFLTLIPIKDISDKDLFGIASMTRYCPAPSGDMHETMSLVDRGKCIIHSLIGENIFGFNISVYPAPQECINIVDYLRSRGYALPYMDWSVDQLVEAGVFKLKEVNND